jgi:hypothetical protein
MIARLLIVLALVVLAKPLEADDDEHMAVIVHPARHMTLSVEELSQIYLRRKRYWDDRAAIVPLNLPAGAVLRARFSRQILRQTDGRLAEYWNRQYFDGILPPATLASAEAMRRYVASDPNAIGYLPLSKVDGSVRVILQLE